MTNVNIPEKRRESVVLDGKRSVVSIRIKPELKEALLRFCQANGLSICHVFEMLVTGYLKGVGEKISNVYKSPTIELSVVREVKRVRRYSDIDSEGREKNFYSFDLGGQWIYRAGALNEKGHAVGCECSRCKPFRPLSEFRGKPRSFGPERGGV